jgi:hypothetical protein
MPIVPLPLLPEDRAQRRAASLIRLRDAAQADGILPARITELEGALDSAFAINDLMASLFGQARD